MQEQTGFDVLTSLRGKLKLSFAPHTLILAWSCSLPWCSATFSDEVKRLVALSLKQPVRLAADAAASVPRALSQEIVRLKVRGSICGHVGLGDLLTLVTSYE